MNNAKLIKAATVMERIIRVLRGIFQAVMWVLLIFAVLTLILGEKMVQPASFTVDLDFIRLTPTEAYQTFTPGMKASTVLGLTGAAVVCFMFYYGAGLLLKISGCMKEGRPFEESAVMNLRKLAWLILIGGTASQLLTIAQQAALAASLPLADLFSTDSVAQINYIFKLDGAYLVLFALLLLLSYIFAYGNALQQDVDDTV